MEGSVWVYEKSRVLNVEGRVKVKRRRKTRQGGFKLTRD
jgi:hypothetical protein